MVKWVTVPEGGTQEVVGLLEAMITNAVQTRFKRGAVAWEEERDVRLAEARDAAVAYSMEACHNITTLLGARWA